MGRDRGSAGSGPPAIRPKTPPRVEWVEGRSMFLARDVLSRDECEAFVRYAENLGFTHQGSRGPKFGEAFRDNDRVSREDAPLAARLWRATGLSALAELDGACGLNPNLRFYRYSAGQRFGCHVDESADVAGHDGGPAGRTEFTLLVYLSGEEGMGGETAFYRGHGRRRRQVAAVAPRQGLALLHRHGVHCLEHEGLEVKKGVKYVLRSDVVFPYGLEIPDPYE